jgi:hypothetical protein
MRVVEQALGRVANDGRFDSGPAHGPDYDQICVDLAGSIGDHLVGLAANHVHLVLARRASLCDLCRIRLVVAVVIAHHEVCVGLEGLGEIISKSNYLLIELFVGGIDGILYDGG